MRASGGSAGSGTATGGFSTGASANGTSRVRSGGGGSIVNQSSTAAWVYANFYGLAKGYLSGKYRSAADLDLEYEGPLARSQRGSDVRAFEQTVALAGMLGSMMALETIKDIVQAGDSLAGRVFLFDGLAAEARTVKLARDANCPVCGHD